MKAVFKHELDSYFTGLSAYVFGAFMLLFAGIYTMVYNLKNLVTNFEYVVGNMSFVFLIIVPILTMKVISEEKKQRTDQLLYSLPITMTDVILGKYLAMLVMLLIPVLFMAVYPFILSNYGDIYLPASLGTLTGFFFLGAALIAIGMFISSITDSQPVAAGVCFIVMLLNYFIADIASYVSDSAYSSLSVFIIASVIIGILFKIMTKSTPGAIIAGAVPAAATAGVYLYDSTLFEGLFPDMMEKVSLFERFYTFVNGVFDITGIVYFVTVSGLFLFLSVQSMEKRRWN